MTFLRTLFLLRGMRNGFARSKNCISQLGPQNLIRSEFIKTQSCAFCTDAQNANRSKVDIVNDTGYAILNKSCSENGINALSVNAFGDNTSNVTLVDPINASDDLFDDLERDLSIPASLDKCTENLSYVGPYLEPTATFAKYANESLTVRELVKLGVNLAKIEKIRGAVPAILSLDFHKRIAPYIQFLHDIGIPADNMGHFITKNPYLFFQDMKNLELRLKYLKAHSFDKNMILTILGKYPQWISFNLKGIDRRLGYFQGVFHLSGREVRKLTVKLPKLITYKLLHIKQNTIAIQGEMGFDKRETKILLLNIPKLWIKSRRKIVNCFDYVHNEMGLSHQQIMDNYVILDSRKSRCEQRHKFLMELNRAQYDANKPLYVSPASIVLGTDEEFCRNIAKCNIDLYNEFLKTL